MGDDDRSTLRWQPAALWFEQCQVGMVSTTRGRTVMDADIVNFAGVSGDFNSLHLDDELMRSSQFGGRIAHGLLVLSIASGLRAQEGLFAGTLLAFGGIRDWRFLAPVRPGDTVRVRSEIVETRPSASGGKGVVVQRVEVLNQRDEAVHAGEFVSIVRMEPAA
jgi:acyl dehydratase